jgi:hypothetical protein
MNNWPQAFMAISNGGVSFAQDHVGNGGGIWACKMDAGLTKGMLLDLFEARKEFKLNLMSPSETDPMKVVNERAAFLRNYWPEMNQEWNPILIDIMRFIRFVDEPLTIISDAFPRIIPSRADGCEVDWQYTQFANYTN